MLWEVEYTDTFGGEANYSWVDRHEIHDQGLTDAQIIRRAKSLVGLTGVKCDTSNYGDMIEIRPRGSCTVLFVTANY